MVRLVHFLYVRERNKAWPSRDCVVLTSERGRGRRGGAMGCYCKYNSEVNKYKSQGIVGQCGERHGGGQFGVCAGGLSGVQWRDSFLRQYCRTVF
jgi:hypothetical protein